MASLKDYLRVEQGAFLSSNKKWVATQPAPSSERSIDIQLETLNGKTDFVAPETGWLHVEAVAVNQDSYVNVVSVSQEAWLSCSSASVQAGQLLTAQAFVQKGRVLSIWVDAKSTNVVHFIPSVGSQ